MTLQSQPVLFSSQIELKSRVLTRKVPQGSGGQLVWESQWVGGAALGWESVSLGSDFGLEAN